MTPILLSLRPVYADLVFKGLKRAELRRRIPSQMEGRDVFIYVSSPVRCLRGGFTVDRVWTGSPDIVWNQVSALAHVDRKTFDSYYAGRSVAFALRIASVWEHENPSDLAMLRKKFPDFVVPQSWRYLRPEEYRSFRRMNRVSEPETDTWNRLGDVGEFSRMRNVTQVGGIRESLSPSHRRPSIVPPTAL